MRRRWRRWHRWWRGWLTARYVTGERWTSDGRLVMDIRIRLWDPLFWVWLYT
jgi:hypothetical protein